MSASTDDLDPELSFAATISRKDSSVRDNHVIPMRPKERNDCDGEGGNAEDGGNLGHEGDST